MFRHVRQGQEVKFLAPTCATTAPRDVEPQLAACNLPRRQVEVCARILLGLSREEISSDLGIGVETVQTHRKRAYLRLHVTNDQELVVWFESVNRPSRTA